MAKRPHKNLSPPPPKYRWLVYSLLALLAIGLLVVGLTSACRAETATQASAIENQFDATCRISCGGGQEQSVGTGSVIGIDRQWVLVLTNAHVVGNEKTCRCEFWKSGYQSEKILGQVYTTDRQNDVATILVPVGAFGGVLPKCLTMASATPPVGATVRSVGCAAGSWATAWQGHVTRYNGGQMWFVPPPANGRSGSAITDERGQLVGLLRVRNGEGEGGAVDLATLKSLVLRQTTAAADSFQLAGELTQWVPAAGCGPLGCPRPFVRDPQREQMPAPQNPYPQLPPQIIQAPAAPPVDLSPILDRLDRIGSSIQPREASPVAPQAPVGPDPATVNALQQLGGAVNQHGQAIEQIKQDVPRAIESAVKPLHEKIGAVGETMEKIDRVVRPLSALREKLEEDAAAGGIKGRIAQRMLDSGDDPTAWIKHAMIVLGVILGIGLVIGIIHAIHAAKSAVANGQPTPLEKRLDDMKARLQGAAIANPALAPVAAGATAIDALADRLRAQLFKASDGTSPVQVHVSTPSAATSAPGSSPVKAQ